MSALNSLKLVAAVRVNQLSPIQFRRNKLVAKIADQINLAQAMKEGREYMATRVRTIKDRVSGETQTVEQSRKVRQWWFRTESGKTCLQLKYGVKVIAFAKGKNAIEVSNEADLVSVLETLKKAVEGGELDAQMGEASEAVKKRFKK